MSSKRYDVIVVGCGIAGAAIAWRLHWQNKKLLVIDDQTQISASHVAAGVISPITGRRHTTAWRWQDFWPEAASFYRKVESSTDLRLLQLVPQLRFPQHPASEQIRDRLSQVATLSEGLPDHFPSSLRPEITEHGVIEIENGVLDVGLFLEATYQMLAAHHRFHNTPVAHSDMTIDDNGVSIAGLDATAEHIAFCEGAHGAGNPWFAGIPFEPVRGESLIVNIDKLSSEYIYHHGISLVPTNDHHFYAGATYDWQNIDTGCTLAGKQEISALIRQLTTHSFEIISHQSGIRPVIRGRRPTIRQHARFRHCWFFNGLASSGCLQAPLLAKRLGKAIITGNLDEARSDISLNQPLENPAGCVRLTTRAHQLISASLRNGDIAIDATAGNGNDTKFLAEHVGALGQVFAFDIQALALERSAKRLADLPYENVQFELKNHCELASIIPEALHGNIAVVMFNLGYLPGAIEDLITLPTSTCVALESALALIKPGGLCTVLCYRGHSGGAEEANQVATLLDSLDEECFNVELFQASKDEQAPILYCVTKLDSLTELAIPAP